MQIINEKKIIEYFQHVITSNINVIRKLNVVHRILKLKFSKQKKKLLV